MANIILFDDNHWKSLLPLCFTRPISELRVGILTIKQKWEHYLQAKASYITQDYLSEKFPIRIQKDNLIINACMLPNERIVKLLQQLEDREALLYEDELIAARLDETQFDRLINNKPMEKILGMELKKGDESLDRIRKPEDIFLKTGAELQKDFTLLTKGKRTSPISPTNRMIGEENIFLEEGVKMEYCTLNAQFGPIYLARKSEIMEGTMVRGGLFLGANSTLKMGTKIYGPCSIGPHCKIGGEIKNSVVLGYSNKAHDGFLGNSVIGEWCNLGADSNSSNMKNNYNTIKMWDYGQESFRNSELQFCGLVMGDHSKCGINTMFNSGTIVGVFTNIFGAGYPEKFIPSFSWGGPGSWKTYDLEKALALSEKVMQRKNTEILEAEQKILRFIFHKTEKYRTWEYS